MRRTQSYSGHEDLRQQLMLELFMNGLTIGEMSGLMHCSEAIIAADVRRLRRTVPLSRSFRVKAFEAMLMHYAWLVEPAGCAHEQYAEPIRDALRPLIGAWLRVDEIIGLIQGIGLTHEHLTQPGCPAGHERTIQLLDDLFNTHSQRTLFNAADRREMARLTWHDLLRYISRSGAVPTTRDAIYNELIKQIDLWRPNVMLPWPEQVFQDLELAITHLPPRDRLAINLRYGVGTETRTHTFPEIGNALGCTPSRAGAITQRALRKLRHPSTGVGSYHRLKQSLQLHSTDLVTHARSKQRFRSEFSAEHAPTLPLP
ncbi:MAG: sigma factor-like helix-turn-helix DNA-binding protein [bacterium]|nr:sigma factor-like helix-turn-helix DNA-binding protein [bacterium]